MSKTSERVVSYTEKFRKDREGHSLSQLEAEKADISEEMERLVEDGEYHSFWYAQAEWEYDVLEMIIRERKEAA
jgi:hypothetical protein